MGRDDKFIVDQLRKDKIIYATEAAATNVLMLVILYFSTSYFTGALKAVVDVVAVLIAVAYTFYMGAGNFIRLQSINRYGKDL